MNKIFKNILKMIGCMVFVFGLITSFVLMWEIFDDPSLFMIKLNNYNEPLIEQVNEEVKLQVIETLDESWNDILEESSEYKKYPIGTATTYTMMNVYDGLIQYTIIAFSLSIVIGILLYLILEKRQTLKTIIISYVITAILAITFIYTVLDYPNNSNINPFPFCLIITFIYVILILVTLYKNSNQAKLLNDKLKEFKSNNK